ncbi:MAG: tetratricopeptide repeat protein [Acidobacteriaceae bacterium]|nr:tetratricopeptide repeat protein [Acidobacteriaceae bacterium]
MKYVFTLAGICTLLFSSACSQSPERLIATGNRYHNQKKFKEASILYQKAIAKDKTNAEAYYRQGLNLLDDGNPVEASKYFRRAIDLKPDNTDATIKLAEIYLGAYASNPAKLKNFLSDAKDLDNKVLQQNPNSFDGMRIQGLLHLAENDRDGALASFAKANKIKPHSRELIGWYAQTLIAAQRPQEADALVRDMIAHDKTWGPGYDFLFALYSRQNDKAKAENVLQERVGNDPASPVAVLNLSNYLLLSNRYDEAEALMKRVISDKKNFPAGRQMLGDFYMRAKKFDQALEQYQAGVKEDSKNALQYQQRIVAIYEATGRRDEALKLAKNLASDHPKDATTGEVYSTLLLGSGSKNEAAKSVDELKTLVANNPSDGALHFQLARAYFGLGQPDKALSEALEAIQDESKSRAARPIVLIGARTLAARVYEDRGDHAKAIEQAEVVLSANPKLPDARLIRDRALIGTNQIDKAKADLEALVQEFPGMNDARLQLAGLYIVGREYDKATAEFDKVWKSNPPDNRGLLGLQAVKLSQGKGDEAVATIRDLVQKNPTVPAYREQLASFEATAGAQIFKSDPEKAKQLYQQAADDYKELLKINPKSSDLWLRMGVIQRQLGQFDQALGSFEQASKVDPRNINALLNQALLQEALGKKGEAANIYNRILGLDPDNALALNNVAFMEAEKGTNLDQAMTFAERAKKRVPNSPDISDTLGYVYLQKNLNSEALRIFRQIVQEDPKNPTFHYHLAMALLKQGDKQGAKDEAQKALQGPLPPEQQDKIRTFVNQIG